MGEQQKEFKIIITEKLRTYNHPADVDDENLDCENPSWDMIKNLKDENQEIDTIEFYYEDGNILALEYLKERIIMNQYHFNSRTNILNKTFSSRMMIRCQRQ